MHKGSTNLFDALHQVLVIYKSFLIKYEGYSLTKWNLEIESLKPLET